MSTSQAAESEKTSADVPKPRRWGRRLLWFGFFSLTGLAVAVWFAPQIVCHASLRPKAIGWALDGQPVKVELGGAEFGWLRPIVATDVSVADAEGNTLLKAKEVRSSATLWELIRGYPKLGRFVVVEPAGSLILRSAGSNIEDVIAAIPASSSSGPAPEFLIELVNAKLDIEHPAVKRKSTLAGIDAKLDFGQSGLTRAIAEMPSKVADGESDAGQLALFFGDAPDESTNAGGSKSSDESKPPETASASGIQQISATVAGRQLRLKAKEWRLDWLNPILARWQPEAELSGLLNAKLKAVILAVTGDNGGAMNVTARGELSISQVMLAGLTGMKSDTLKLAEVSLRGEVATDGNRVKLDEAELKTDVGSITATGDVPLSDWSFSSPEQAFDKLSAETFRLDSQIDLAKLAALLPETLAVREGTQITGGSVKATLLSQPKDTAVGDSGLHRTKKLSGKVAVASLSAIADGKSVEWNVPLEAVASVHRDQNEFVFDRLTCRSDFLQADATGTLSRANFAAKADLDKLHQNLSRFFDWGIDRLSGQLQADGRIHQGDDGEIALSAKTQLTAFELGRPGESPWREQLLNIDITAAGRLSDQQQPERIDSAEFTVQSGGDRLKIKLLESVDLLSKEPRWRGEADLIGELKSWQTRLRPVRSLDGWQLAGQIDARVDAELTPKQLDITKLKATVQQLDVRHGEDSIREVEAKLFVAAVASLSDQWQPRRIESGELMFASGGDRLQAKLSEPVDLNSLTRSASEGELSTKQSNPNLGERSPSLALRVSAVADLTGELTSWQSRLRPIVAFDGWQLAGQITAHTEADVGAQRIDIATLTAEIEKLDAKSADYVIREPKVSLETIGQYDVIAERWQSSKLELVSATATIHGRDIDAVLATGKESAKGDADFKIKLGSVSHWLLAGKSPPGYFVGGDASGTLQFQQQAGNTLAKLNTQIQKALVASPTGKQQPAWETLWQEETVSLASEAAYDPVKQSLKLANTKLAADGLEVACAGTVDDLQTTPRLDLSGDLAYDWDRLMLRLGESVRKDFQLAGRDRRPFAIRGSFPSSTGNSSRVPATAASLKTGGSGGATSNDSALTLLTGQAGVGWESATVYGLPLSNGNINTKLQDGVGELTMSDVSVLEGKVRLASQLRFDQTPLRVDLSNQQVVDQVRLSPELCAGWLKFVAPILADATRVDGRFSLSVVAGSLPVTDPAKGSASGKLGIHTAQLTPGPFAMQIISVVDQIKVLTKSGSASDPNKQRVFVTLPEQQVPFKLADGRVHHEGLTLVSKDVTLKTRGSVGIDESLDMIIDVPVKDEWLNSNKLLASLRGKTLSIPVRGTLARPQIDDRIFQQLAREAAAGAVQNLLGDQLQKNTNGLDQQLQKGLNKLLPGKK